MWEEQTEFHLVFRGPISVLSNGHRVVSGGNDLIIIPLPLACSRTRRVPWEWWESQRMSWVKSCVAGNTSSNNQLIAMVIFRPSTGMDNKSWVGRISCCVEPLYRAAYFSSTNICGMACLTPLTHAVTVTGSLLINTAYNIPRACPGTYFCGLVDKLVSSAFHWAGGVAGKPGPSGRFI